MFIYNCYKAECEQAATQRTGEVLHSRTTLDAAFQVESPILRYHQLCACWWTEQTSPNGPANLAMHPTQPSHISQ